MKHIDTRQSRGNHKVEVYSPDTGATVHILLNASHLKELGKLSKDSVLDLEERRVRIQPVADDKEEDDVDASGASGEAVHDLDNEDVGDEEDDGGEALTPSRGGALLCYPSGMPLVFQPMGMPVA